jgi:phosphinothricin acetyltransferase
MALHAKHGFVEVGRMREVVFKFGQWRDVVYLQRDLPAPP